MYQEFISSFVFPSELINDSNDEIINGYYEQIEDYFAWIKTIIGKNN